MLSKVEEQSKKTETTKPLAKKGSELASQLLLSALVAQEQSSSQQKSLPLLKSARRPEPARKKEITKPAPIPALSQQRAPRPRPNQLSVPRLELVPTLPKKIVMPNVRPSIPAAALTEFGNPRLNLPDLQADLSTPNANRQSENLVDDQLLLQPTLAPDYETAPVTSSEELLLAAFNDLEFDTPVLLEASELLPNEPEQATRVPIGTEMAEQLIGMLESPFVKPETLLAVAELSENLSMANERLQVLYNRGETDSQEVIAIEELVAEWYTELLEILAIEPIDETIANLMAELRKSSTGLELSAEDYGDLGMHEQKTDFDFVAMLQRIADDIKRRLRSLKVATFVMQQLAA